MSLSNTYLYGVLAVAGIGAVGAYLFLRYRRAQQYEKQLEALSRDISRAVDRRGARNPQLIENKLAAAEEKWKNGDYKAAERTMEDLLRIVQLS